MHTDADVEPEACAAGSCAMPRDVCGAATDCLQTIRYTCAGVHEPFQASYSVDMFISKQYMIISLDRTRIGINAYRNMALTVIMSIVFKYVEL